MRSMNNNPPPSLIRTVRKEAKLSQSEAAKRGERKLRIWQGYEGGEKPIPKLVWREFLRSVKDLSPLAKQLLEELK